MSGPARKFRGRANRSESELAESESAVPESALPESALPESALPGLAQPGSTEPESAQPDPEAESGAAASAGDAPPEPNFGGWMGSMWLFTGLRFGLFFALWGILYLIGFRSFAGPLVALVLSVPLSFVLLSGPRHRFTRKLESRLQAHQVERADLDAQLDPGTAHIDDDL